MIAIVMVTALISFSIGVVAAFLVLTNGNYRDRFAIGINWRDLFFGVYVGKDRRAIFVCLVPCVVIAIGDDAARRLNDKIAARAEDPAK